MAELHRAWVSAVLAADAQDQIRAGLTAQLSCHFHQFTYAGLIQSGKWVGFIDLMLIIVIQEFAGVITAKPKGHLGQIVVPKLKNSASLAISSAVSAARGISIIVPTR